MSSPLVSRSPSDRADARALRFALGLLAAGAVVGCTALSGAFEGPVADAPPEVPPGPTFSHVSHIAKGLECVDCHTGLEDEGAEPGMPEVELCIECHEDIDEEKPKEKTVAAFLGPDEQPQWKSVTKLDDEIKFSHAPHLAKKVECGACHTGIEESERITRELRIDEMQECMDCHAERDAPNECATCHTYVGRDWMPPSHDRMWEVRHGQLTRMDSPTSLAEDCAMCHTQQDCASCHRTTPPRTHTNAWRVGAGHGLAASMDRDRCQACHESDTCIRCHETVEPRSHRAGWGAPRARHCLSGCHIPIRASGPSNCSVCHRGTPSHALAPEMPPWHRPDFDCLRCHSPVPHADDGGNCLRCHE